MSVNHSPLPWPNGSAKLERPRVGKERLSLYLKDVCPNLYDGTSTQNSTSSSIHPASVKNWDTKSISTSMRQSDAPSHGKEHIPPLRSMKKTLITPLRTRCCPREYDAQDRAWPITYTAWFRASYRVRAGLAPALSRGGLRAG